MVSHFQCENVNMEKKKISAHILLSKQQMRCSVDRTAAIAIKRCITHFISQQQYFAFNYSFSEGLTACQGLKVAQISLSIIAVDTFFSFTETETETDDTS